jgi:hypothetical protein
MIRPNTKLEKNATIQRPELAGGVSRSNQASGKDYMPMGQSQVLAYITVGLGMGPGNPSQTAQVPESVRLKSDPG